LHRDSGPTRWGSRGRLEFRLKFLKGVEGMTTVEIERTDDEEPKCISCGEALPEKNVQLDMDGNRYHPECADNLTDKFR